MAINFNSLTEYVEQHKLPLIGEAVLKAKTTSLVNVQSGVKYKEAINLVNVNPTLQDGSACGWNANGDTEISQRIITAPVIKVNQAFCHKDFLKYWTNYESTIGAGNESLPFEEYFVSQIVDNIKAKNEKLIWQGDTDSEDAELGLTDGVLKVVGDDVVTAATAASAYTAIQNVYMAIPENVLDKAVIFVGSDTYRKFIQEMVAKNYYHYSANGTDNEFMFPATNTKVVAVNGLNGTKKIVATDPANIYVGCDNLEDSAKFDLFYSKDNDEFRLKVEYNLGTQVAFPNNIVIGGLN